MQASQTGRLRLVMLSQPPADRGIAGHKPRAAGLPPRVLHSPCEARQRGCRGAGRDAIRLQAARDNVAQPETSYGGESHLCSGLQHSSTSFTTT